MSLSRLLRHTPSETSDPLTFSAVSGGSRGELDGEIVFSKNNVCVHPTESLPGQTEHHPGYLCVQLEKDEELGTTLILTWVPNSRINQRDEEALRYVTPDGSPIHRNPRRSPLSLSARPPPTPEGPEEGGTESPLRPRTGSQQLEDLPVGSDQDPCPSPSCPSPTCEALPAGSVSVLQENNSREVCRSASPASGQDSHAPPESSQSEAARWEEQQKGLASEPLCGVFRVDLGHMRSLRLFFSDEACTSGQLVIASRENKFKILHFHHAGLDKVAEVFQHWKCCQETQLKDQVWDGRSRAHFLVLRPAPSPADAHPEERLHRRLDLHTWLRHRSPSGQVEEQHSLRKAIFFGGIDPAARGRVWPFLLRYYSWDSTETERQAWRLQKHSEYHDLQQRRLSMSTEEQSEFWRKVQFTVDRDVVRTDCGSVFFRGENNPNVESMRCILLNYAVFDPETGYCQGMSDLLAPLLTEVQDESDTFWCFVGLMENASFISSPYEENMEKQLVYLREMLRLMLPGFHQYLTQLGEDGLQLLFCHRWLLLCFRREFPYTEALQMWEACWVHYQTDHFHLFLCAAVIALYGDGVVERRLAVDQTLLHFGGLSMRMDGELVLRKARSLLYQFSLLPRIPCTLHNLCKLCGPGMWDSGCIPEVECSGEHPEPHNCPYGGPATLVTPPSPQPALPSQDKGGPGTLDVFSLIDQP